MPSMGIELATSRLLFGTLTDWATPQLCVGVIDRHEDYITLSTCEKAILERFRTMQKSNYYFDFSAAVSNRYLVWKIILYF